MSNTELMVIMAMTPFVILGVRALARILIEKSKVSHGCIKTQLILQNRRLKSYFVKPDSDEIKIGKKRLGFDGSAEKMVIEGNVPVAFYNAKTSEQLNMFSSKTSYPVDPEYFDNIVIRAYNLGKLSAIVNEQKLLLVCIIACIVGGISIVVGGMCYLKLTEIAKAVVPVVVG